MNQLEAFLEKTWDSLLSRNPQRITRTFTELDPASQHVVIEHLKKMTSDSGWQAEQVISARAALHAIQTVKAE
ncbi:MAG: hypothetical protein AB9897_06405 [Anaerolineaceae bacterium]